MRWLQGLSNALKAGMIGALVGARVPEAFPPSVTVGRGATQAYALSGARRPDAYSQHVAVAVQ